MSYTKKILCTIAVITSVTKISYAQDIPKIPTNSLSSSAATVDYSTLDTNGIRGLEKTISKDVNLSRDNIASLTEVKDIKLVHRGLTLWLLSRLELLTNETNKDVIKVNLEEVANRFYLLDKVAKAHNLTNLGKSSILKTEQEKVNKLISKHSEHNTLLSTTADEIFQKQGLLEHEHLIYMLSNWMEGVK